ncbi:hypothetical protein [uncultured Megasphaera sp.]|uniref:hypothetical protein n=1 Tax=uncultured Megasphaera sp. TaxID=165188 RepID=UPI0026064D57|nr:hypothetical protein [uncultured Megasphaera sp.]
MISIHDIKDALIILGFVICFGGGMVNVLRKDFRKEFLHLYQYSIPFIGGCFLLGSSLLGLIFSFYYFIDYALWVTLLVFLGGAIMIYGRGALAKYEYKEERSKMLIGDAKDMLGYIIILFFILILKEWFI